MLSNGSDMQSFGETHCGSTGPPAPMESTNRQTPEPFAEVTNALNVQIFGGVAVGEGPGEGEELNRLLSKNRDSVPVPLSLRLYENCWGVI